jgi:hypothetical protein
VDRLISSERKRSASGGDDDVHYVRGGGRRRRLSSPVSTLHYQMLFRSNSSRLGFTNSRSFPRVVGGVRLDWNFFSSSFIQKWPASLVLVILCTNRICRLILNFIATSCYE